MAVRYRGFWNDVQGNEYQLVISNTNYNGIEEEITCEAVIGQDASNNIFQAIRSTYASINVIASLEQTFEDLWAYPTNSWQVQIYIFAQPAGFWDERFRGGLDMEEVEQPFDAIRWPITLEARCALGWLEEYKFVQDDGTPWEGQISVIQTIARALKRGYPDESWALRIYGVTPWDLTNDNSFLNAAYIKAEAFIEDDGNPSNCKDVVEAMVSAMGCTIFQYRKRYYIIPIWKWIALRNVNVEAQSYDADGLVDSFTPFVIDGGPEIPQQYFGTEGVSEASVFHVGKTASYRIKRELFSTTWFHPWEFRENIIPNGEIVAPEEAPGPYTMPPWTLESGRAEAGPNQILIDAATNNPLLIAASSDPIRLIEGNTLEVEIDLEYDLDNSEPEQQYMQFKLDGDSGDTWYWIGSAGASGRWYSFSQGSLFFGTSIFVLHDKQFDFPTDTIGGVPDWRYEISIGGLPESGDFSVVFFQPSWVSPTANNKVIINSVLVEATDNGVEGVQSKVSRIDQDAGRVGEPREVRFATSETAAIKNTFYDVNGDVITEIKRSILAIEPSLQALATMEALINYNQTKDISGEFIGEAEHYIPKRVMDIGGDYIVVGIDKNLTNNISRVRLSGYSKEATEFDLLKETDYKYSNVITPKIKS